MAMEKPAKPSFLRSMWEGIKGYIKGAIAGGIIGIVAGGIIGGLLSAFVPGAGEAVMAALSTHGSEAAAALMDLGAPAAGAILGASTLGSAFSTMGGMAGAVTGVVRSRETEGNMVPAEQAMNAVKVAVVQGMAIENQRAAAQETTHWREMHAKREAAKALQPTMDAGQRLHS